MTEKLRPTAPRPLAPDAWCLNGNAEKARAVARALGAAFDKGADVPSGTGVHTGTVYIGTVKAAQGTFRDISIFGHAVNVTARLASSPQAGQALASDTCTTIAGLSVKVAQTLHLKGMSAPVIAGPV